MPDIIRSSSRCLRRFLRDAEPRTRRSKAQETALAIDHLEIAAAEAYDMAAGSMHGEAETLARECLTNEHVVAMPVDLAGGTHPADLVIGFVPGVIKAPRACAAHRSTSATSSSICLSAFANSRVCHFMTRTKKEQTQAATRRVATQYLQPSMKSNTSPDRYLSWIEKQDKVI